MREQGGRILNFGSDAGLLAYPSAAHYSASKGAVTSWTRSIAASWGRYGITANTIVPAMWTPMYDEHRAQFTAEELVAHDAAMAQMIARSEEHTSELQSLMRISYAVFCLKKQTKI